MAFQGVDLRDLYRRGSGLTLRRLSVLVRHLPYDAPLWVVLDSEDAEDEQQEPEQPRQAAPDQIRDRAEFYRQQAATQTEGVSHG